MKSHLLIGHLVFGSTLSSHIRLRSAKKYVLNGNEITTRTISPKETLSNMMPIIDTIGITRVSDITQLDRLYVPNYTVTLPGTEDSIWVYSGKGQTKLHAKVSAIMEAVERYSSLSGTGSKIFVQGTHSELSKSYPVLHPNDVMEPVTEVYHEKESVLDYLPGYDLLNQEDILVPAQLALSRYCPRLPAVCGFPYSHTNGLASGNVLEEAVCHALCEVIERDAVSISDLCCSSIPYTILKKILLSVVKLNHIQDTTAKAIDKTFVDDSSLFPDMDISEYMEFEQLRILVKKFKKGGLPLLIKNITMDDIGIPTFVASCAEWISDTYGLFAKGYGCHPDARIALMRAITEVSQTRVGNIQGSRDDLKKVKYQSADNIVERKWQFIPAQGDFNKVHNILKLSQIRTYENRDMFDDIKILLKRLKKAGLKRVIIVQLTDPRINVPVVRAIVPGLETFEVAKLFTNRITIGSRAKSTFKKLLSVRA